MEFLAGKIHPQRLLFASSLTLLILFLNGCTGALEPKHVASIPLVMLQKTPIPEQAKHRDSQVQTLDEDVAISAWFVGAEGWQTDAMARSLKKPSMHQAQESYFEGYFENLFINIIALNYEAVQFRGHWVKMVPKKLPPIILSPVLGSKLPVPSAKEEQP